MSQNLPCADRDALESFISASAMALGFEPKALTQKLEAVGKQYIFAIENYRNSSTRGAVLQSLADVLERPDYKLASAISILDRDATHALMGRFPSSFMRYIGMDGNQHIAWVADDEAIAVALFKSKMALQSLSGQANLLKVKLQRTGIGGFDIGKEAEARACYGALADMDPGFVREHVAAMIELLTEIFELQDSSDARNIKLLDGARANTDWQLIGLILDIVWPMERGEFHSKKMEHLRELVNGVVRYVWGETRPRRGAPTKRDDGREKDGELLFDPMLLSGVLTLRHQINSLTQALKAIERRMQTLERECGDVVTHLYKIAYYPLLDWKRELERRLLFGDYRPKNANVRRYTGEVVITPPMPKFKKIDDATTRTLALIEAASPLVKGGRDMERDAAILARAFSI